MLWDHVVAGQKGNGMGHGRLSRLRGGRRRVRCHHLLCEGEGGIIRIGPPGKPEEEERSPTRYGDWEKKGIAIDF